MKNLCSNSFFITLEEKWGYNLLDFMFGQQIRMENQMKKDLLDSILPFKYKQLLKIK